MWSEFITSDNIEEVTAAPKRQTMSQNIVLELLKYLKVTSHLIPYTEKRWSKYFFVM